MGKHVPGPWHREGSHIVAGSVRVAVVDTPDTHAGVDYEEAEGNANLIAAAPDLLEACLLVEQAQRDGDYMKAFAAVTSAITKATGEQQ